MNSYHSFWRKLPTRNVFRNLGIVAIALVVSLAASAQVTFTGTQASLWSGSWSAPSMVAVDNSGNAYVADSGSNRVFQLVKTATGLAQPVAIDANLSAPNGVAVDWYGNVYISDSGNNRIMMLPLTKTGLGTPVQVIAGLNNLNNLNNPGGLAVDLGGNIFVADTGNNRVIEIPFTGSAYGAPVTVATGLSAPQDVALDAAKNLYIADTGNHRVLKATLASGLYSAPAQLVSGVTPTSVSVDRSNNLYIGDGATERLIEDVWQSWANRYGALVVLSGDFVSLSGMATDAVGNVYVTDGAGQLVQLAPLGMNFGSVNVGGSAAVQTYDFTISAGTTVGNVSILMQGLAGKDYVDAGSSSCTAQTYTATSYCSVNVNFVPTASGTREGAINLFDGSGNPLATAFLSGTGVQPHAGYFPGTVTLLGNGLSGPSGVAVDGAGNVYIADSGNDRVVMLPWTGTGFGQQVTLPIPGISNPMGLAIDGAGNLFVASNGNDRVIKLPRTQTGFGTASKVGTGLNGPMGVTVDGNGAVYIADTLNARVDKLTWSGSAYAAEVQLGNYHRSPIGIAVDSNGDVYFSDPYQGQLATVQWAGTSYLVQSYITAAGKDFDAALAVDGNSNLYVLDATTNSVVMLPATGSGFGPPQTVALGFNAPAGMTIDGNGVLYVADTGNNQIVRVDFSAPQPVTFNATNVGSMSSDSSRMTVMQNLGNESITLTSATYPVDFPEASGAAAPCLENTTLGSNQWCQIAVNFVPQTVGSPLTESVQIAGNLTGNGTSQQTLALSGASLPVQAQTISFPGVPAAVYGGSPITLAATATSGLPVAFTVLSGPASLTSSGRMLRFSGVGTVVVQANQAGNSAYQPAAAVILSIQVTPGTLTVTPNHSAAIYGAIPTAFSYTLTGFASGDTIANSVTGQPVVGSNAQPNSGAGTYVLTASPGTLSAANYSFTFSPGVLTVNKAPLHIFPTALKAAYGAAPPRFAWTFSGLMNGDAPSVLTGSPAFATTATIGSPIGSYPITATAGTLAAANYAFDIRSATLTVTTAMLSVTATNQSIQYGAAIPSLAYTITGFANGDTAQSAMQGAPVLSTTATRQSGAGSYEIVAALGSLTSNNYCFQLVNGSLTVNKAVVTVTPVNATITYGASLPRFSFVFSGWINGDSAANAIAGLPTVATQASSQAKPGSYVLTASAGTMTSKNYSFTFGTAALQINKAMLTVTATSATMSYGGSLPNLAYKLSGFVAEDGPAQVTGAPSVTTTATATSAAGAYPITAGVGTLTSPWYNFQVSAGKLTVYPVALFVNANPLSMVYGAAVPKLTYSVTGFVGGDTVASISGSAALTTTAGAAPQAGAYPITVAIGSMTAKSYSIRLVNSVLTVNKAVLKVTASNATMTYGSALPQLSYTLAGFAQGDAQITAVTGAPQLTSTATASSAVGTYPISVVAGSLAAQNYTFQFSGAQLVINKAPLSIAANNLSMKAGSTIPALTFTATGLVNGDTLATAVTGAPKLTTTATASSAAGTYPVTVAAGTLSAKNYQPSYSNGTLTVSQ